MKSRTKWWGARLTPARVEGASVLTESMAWHSAMGVVERTFGREHLERLWGMMREEYITPRTRANFCTLCASMSVPSLSILQCGACSKHGAGSPPLPTSLDLYRELQAVTPESLLPLLGDLF